MPQFMDVHTTMKGVLPQAPTEAHNADLAIQDNEGVTFKQAWASDDSADSGALGLTEEQP